MESKKPKAKSSSQNLDLRTLKISEKIKKLRIDAGFTSSETFSYEHSLSRVHYWRVEKGSNITMETLIKILDIHKISLEEFFKGL